MVIEKRNEGLLKNDSPKEKKLPIENVDVIIMLLTMFYIQFVAFFIDHY